FTIASVSRWLALSVSGCDSYPDAVTRPPSAPWEPIRWLPAGGWASRYRSATGRPEIKASSTLGKAARRGSAAAAGGVHRESSGLGKIGRASCRERRERRGGG